MTLPHGFVDLAVLVPDAILDIRYATVHNFTGAILPGYDVAAAWCDARFGERVVAGATRLRARGLGLMIFDAYRPLRAARAMVAWAERTGNAWVLDGYVSATSRHCRGLAVDLSTYDLATGERTEMGTDVDAFGPSGHTRSAVGRVLDHRLTLREAMLAAGCEDYHREWWHFDAPDLDGPLRDVPYG